MSESKPTSSQILSVFTNRYMPSELSDTTDFFTSTEIQQLIYKHIGHELSLAEIHNYLRALKYDYEIIDQEFNWLTKKTTVLNRF